MGACCESFFLKEEIHTNESRLKLLENKVNASYHTENDACFTYYLHVFEQHIYLEKVLRNYKMVNEQTEDMSEYTVANEKIVFEHKQIQEYVRAFDDAASPLRLKIREDEEKIAAELKLYKQIEPNSMEACMVKFQIQSMEVVKGISRIRIVQQFGSSSDRKQKEEYLIVNRMNKQVMYREFIFPSVVKSRIKLITDPATASMTIDVEDIAKSEAICDVFNFKAKNEDFGFIALRMQYVTRQDAYLKEKHQKLIILQKELKLCQMGKDGLQRLSEYHSDSNSVRNTFLSEIVSQYPNQYQA